MWIKICGMRTVEAINAAIDAGADALGFVFAPSKRQVTTAQALEITRSMPRAITRVAVMQHPSQALVDEVCDVFAPDVLQTDYEDIAQLRLPSMLTTLPVFRGGKMPLVSLPGRLLFEGPTSGAGEVSDWLRAAELARQTQLILAGGLNAHNVAEAITSVKPFGVDVSSGVESTPGNKDSRKIFDFVTAAKTAAKTAARTVER